MDTKEEGSSSGIEDEKLQLLKQDEKRTRVFVRGESEYIDEFIQSISLKNWYKDSQVEGKHAQVNLKYPVYGSQILEAIPPNIFSVNTRHSCCQEDAVNSNKKVRLQLLTSNNPYYSLKKMRALKRQHSSSSSSSLASSSQQSSFLNRSGIGNDLDSCCSSSSLIVMINSKNEEFKLLVTETSKEWMQFMKTQSEQSQKQQSDTHEMMKSLLNQVAAILESKNFRSSSSINEGDSNSNSSNNFLLLSSSSQCQQQSQQQQQQQQQNQSKAVEEEEESDYCNYRQKQTKQLLLHHLDRTGDNNSSKSSRMIIFKRINELIGKLRVYTYQDIQDILVSKEGFDFHEVMEVFANKKLQIDNLIEIFRPGNVPSHLYAQQYQQQTQTVQQYQQNQQQEIIQHYYHNFIQQGQQFTVQDEQQQSQQVIEIEDENGQKNSSGSNGNINIKQLAQLNIVQQEDDNEINKLSSSQMNATKNRERSLSPLHHRQKDAQQKSIDNNKKGYEQKMQKQSYSLSNDPKSKPIRSKSPNSNNGNKSRSITPQKNLNLNQ